VHERTRPAAARLPERIPDRSGRKRLANPRLPSQQGGRPQTVDRGGRKRTNNPPQVIPHIRNIVILAEERIVFRNCRRTEVFRDGQTLVCMKEGKGKPVAPEAFAAPIPVRQIADIKSTFDRKPRQRKLLKGLDKFRRFAPPSSSVGSKRTTMVDTALSTICFSKNGKSSFGQTPTKTATSSPSKDGIPSSGILNTVLETVPLAIACCPFLCSESSRRHAAGRRKGRRALLSYPAMEGSHPTYEVYADIIPLC